MLFVAASFVKILPFNSAFAASGLEGENIRTLCGSADSAVWLVLAEDIVGNFELHRLATFSRLCLAEFTGLHTSYVSKADSEPMCRRTRYVVNIMGNVNMFRLLATILARCHWGKKGSDFFHKSRQFTAMTSADKHDLHRRTSVSSIRYMYLIRPTLHFTHTTNMPHFPEASHQSSGTMELPTREREREEHSDHRPHPPSTNSAERASRLRIQTRRRRYLALNPSYFDGSNLEHAGPSSPSH